MDSILPFPLIVYCFKIVPHFLKFVDIQKIHLPENMYTFQKYKIHYFTSGYIFLISFPFDTVSYHFPVRQATIVLIFWWDHLNTVVISNKNRYIYISLHFGSLTCTDPLHEANIFLNTRNQKLLDKKIFIKKLYLAGKDG